MSLKTLANKLDKYIYFMLLFTVAIIPLNQAFTAFCTAVTFLASIFVAMQKGRQQPKVLKSWQQAFLYLLLFIGIISLHFSLDKFVSSWNYLYVAGQYSALFFVLLRYGWERPQVFGNQKEDIIPAARCNLWNKFTALPRPIQLIAAFLSVSILVSIIGITQKFLGVTADGVWVDPAQFPEIKVRVFSTLVNPNILAGYLILIIAYSTSFFNLTKGKKNLRLIFLVIGILAAWCLLYTYSRGNWLSCLSMMIAFCILFCRKAFIPIFVGLCGALVLGGQSVLHRLSSIGSNGDTSIALRMAYLKSTQWIIEEYPFGVGWYGYRFVYPTYNFYLADKSVIMYHCHNIFLNILAELGWHGLLVFLIIWFGIFLPAGIKLAYGGRSWWLKAMGQGYVLATIGIIVGGLTDHVYFNTQMGLLFWLLSGLNMICSKLNIYEK